MDDKGYRIIEIKENILADNDKDAEALRAQLKEKGTFFLNIMSSPGSGKTTTLTQVIPRLAKKYKIGVMEADIDSDVDAAPYFTFDLEKCKANALMRNPNLDIIPISAKTGEGIDELCAWLEKEIETWKN